MKRLIATVCVCAGGVGIFAGSATAATTHHDCYWKGHHYHDCDGRGHPITSTKTHRHTSHHKITAVSAWDKQYLKTSLEGDLFEIQGGKLAQSKSHDAAILKLADTLIKDHTKSFDDGAKIARKLGIEVPKEPAPSMQWELQMVSQLNGSEFNHQYALLEVYDHRQDIQETKDEISDGTNSDVRDDAKTELPVLQKHLKLAEDALSANK